MSRRTPSAMLRNRTGDRGEETRAVGKKPAEGWGIRQAMLIATLAGLLIWLLIFVGLSFVAW